MMIDQNAVGVALGGRFQLVREIGRGASATVFEATDLQLDRTVAIKVLEPEIARTLGSERFLREVHIEARLQHPHILPVLESGDAGGFLYCVYPLVAGTSMRERLTREGPLPIEAALRLAEEVARALDHAHAHGVIHRDIKPENILLSDGQAIICDFGIARALHDGADGGLTATGVSVGTPRYMSPEQASGSHIPDPRSDLYSLGCVFYEMLTGEAPFSGSTSGAVLRQHIGAPIPALSVLRPQVPREIEDLVRSCLAKLPGDRPASGAELAERIAALRRSSGGDRTTIRSRPWPKASGNWLAGAFALGAILVVAWLMVRPSPAEPTIEALAVLPLRNLTGEPGQDYFSDGVTEALIDDLSRIASLRVISRTSAMAFKGSDQPLPEIARRLDVDAVVEGSVTRSDQGVRISARLVQAVPERNLWSGSYERELSDILHLQSDVSASIAGSVHARLTPEERSRFASAARQVDPGVYEACLRGRHQLRTKFDVVAYRMALQEYLGATRDDPTYAPAWAGLAEAYYNLSSIGMPSAEAMPRARVASTRALEIDSTLGEAFTIQGLVLAQYDLEWGRAERSLRRAIALSPSSAHGHWALALLLSETGHQEEALATIQRACKLDPLSAYFRVGLGHALLRTYRTQQARDVLRGVLAEDPSDVAALGVLSSCYEVEGQLDSAMVLAQRMNRRTQLPSLRGQLGRILVRNGRAAEAREILAEFEIEAPGEATTSLGRGMILHALGEKQRAYELFEQALRERDENLIYMIGDPGWREVWADPRGHALIGRMGL